MPERPAPTGSFLGSPTRRRGRKLLVAIPVLLVVLIGASATAGWSYVRWCQGGSGGGAPLTFTIPPGASGDEVIASLHRQGVIRCNLVARIVARGRGQASDFDAGSYELETNMSLDEALDALAEGPIVKSVDITIPEGWTVAQILPEAARQLQVPEPELRAVAESGELSLPPYLPAGKPLEGFLFPKTYTFSKAGLTADDVLGRLLEQFEREAGKLNWSSARRLGLTPYQVVIVASMVEREARLPAERPRIAAVIYNRLRMNEPLGIDATLQYVDPNPANGLTQADLAMKSPYNTRTFKGLPPTPIASPGLASLRAALQPAKTSDWLYVLCGAGGAHRFTDSYKEFLALKGQCLG